MAWQLDKVNLWSWAISVRGGGCGFGLLWFMQKGKSEKAPEQCRLDYMERVHVCDFILELSRETGPFSVGKMARVRVKGILSPLPF